jgi:hypothetical protein
MNWRSKALGVVTATAALLGVSATEAAADRPEKTHFSETDGFTDTSLCGFPIEIESQISGFEMAFTDKAGDLVRVQIHLTLQDTFSANGVTLAGEQYRVLGKAIFQDGELVDFHASGVLEKVKLPDGSIFLGAGRVDVLASVVDFIVAPDNGVAKNQDAFCAALSG